MLGKALAAVFAVAALQLTVCAATVTLAPPSGTTTNVLALYSGDTAVEIAGPGTVTLNPDNTYTGGTTLSGGTLVYSGTYHDGVSPIGSGALNITGGTISGSGTITNDITATAAASFAPKGTLVLSGNNTITGQLQVQTNTLEIAGGTTKVAGISLAPSSGMAHLRQSGGTVTVGANLQLSPVKGITSSYTMTGGTLDMKVGKEKYKILVYGNKGSGASVSTLDVSGDAVIKNVSVLYINKNFDKLTDSSFTINVHDGGRIGFETTVYSSASTVIGEDFTVDGGILANDYADGSSRTGWEWIDSVASIAVGPKGATFTTDNGDEAGMAQIKCPVTAVAAATGETAKGVAFDGGQWEFMAAGNAYEGPTVIKNEAVLFLDAKGTIPSTSTVTVGSGSELCTGGGNKTVTDLVLEKGAILGFGTSSSTPYTLTVTGTPTFPAYAKIKLYNANTPVTNALTTAGTYALLKVPAAYASALAAVKWSCATVAAGDSSTFTVATSGDTATLSMTIAAALVAGTDFTVAAGEECLLGATSVGSETITVNGKLFIEGNLTGTGAGGKVIVENGGVLNVTGTIRPQVSGATFDFYLNEGGSVFMRDTQLSVDPDHPLRFNGGTVYPVWEAGANVTYHPKNQSVLVSNGGVVYDLSHWQDDSTADGWKRISLHSQFNHDPSGAAIDGGITVRGTPGETVLFNFGNPFAGSTMNGGIMVEEGGSIVVSAENPLTNQTVTLLPGSLLRSYSKTVCSKVGSLTFGSAGATKPVMLQPIGKNPTFCVESLSVLSPVEVSFCDSVYLDATVGAGVYKAMVFKDESSSVNTSFFQLPASATSYSLSAETVALTEGDYAGYTALVLTVTRGNTVLDDLTLGTDGTNVTLSADATYNNIYVGDIEGVGSKSLTVTGGEISAQYLYIAYLPVDGININDRHTCTYTQSGGKVSVTRLYSSNNPNDSATGRASSEIILNGGTLEVTDQVRLGHGRQRRGCTSTLTINDGAAMTVDDKMYLTYYEYDNTRGAAQGIVNMNGGTLSVGGDIDLSRCEFHPDHAADGGIFLKGGVLSAQNIIQTAANNPYQRLVFDGGVFAPNAAAANRTLTGLAMANVAAGGAIVDTSALAPGGIYTIAQNLLTDPALDGAVDGGFTKRGTGTLALTGENTFTGPTRVEGGILSITNGAAVPGGVIVSDAGMLDLCGKTVSVGTIAASGLVRNGSLIVTDAIATVDAGSLLSVDGDLTLAPGVGVDFADGDVGLRPLAAASGAVSVPEMVRAHNAGDFNRCRMSVIDGVVYAAPTASGFVISIR